VILGIVYLAIVRTNIIGFVNSDIYPVTKTNIRYWEALQVALILTSFRFL